MHQVNLFRRTAAALLSATISICPTGCTPRDGGGLAHAEQVAATCPTDGRKIAALIESDESGSRRGSTLQPVQQQVIRDVAERTVVCGGHLRLVIFAGSTIGVPVYDSDLRLDGATTNARLRTAPKVVDQVMRRIADALPAASSQLPASATDIVGQLQPGAEYVSQLSTNDRFRLEQVILTDGIQTAGQDLGDPSLAPEQAVALAGTFAVPDLSGAELRLIGIGRQSDGALLPTPYVAALRAFHTAICERTRATCTVVTDAAGA